MIKLQNLYYDKEEILSDYFHLYIYLGYEGGKHKFIYWAAVVRDIKLRLSILSLLGGINIYVSEEEFQDFIPIEKNRDFCKLFVKAIFSRMM